MFHQIKNEGVPGAEGAKNMRASGCAWWLAVAMVGITLVEPTVHAARWVLCAALDILSLLPNAFPLLGLWRQPAAGDALTSLSTPLSAFKHGTTTNRCGWLRTCWRRWALRLETLFSTVPLEKYNSTHKTPFFSPAPGYDDDPLRVVEDLLETLGDPALALEQWEEQYGTVQSRLPPALAAQVHAF